MSRWWRLAELRQGSLGYMMFEKTMEGRGLHGCQEVEKDREEPSAGSQVRIYGAEVGVPFGDRMGRPGLWQKSGRRYIKQKEIKKGSVEGSVPVC